jgi:uncharacterized protein (DUF302 family)
MEAAIPYGLTLDVDEAPEALRPRLEAALRAEGFGVLTEIDVKATLKKKLDEDVPAQWILGACNPPIAHGALAAEPDLGLLLPCNVVLRELPDGKSRVAVMNVRAALSLTGNPELDGPAGEVDARLRRVLESLGG